MTHKNNLGRPGTENRGNPLKVMLVCDDPETGNVWTHMLQKKGLDVSFTDSPSIAIKEKEEEPPDLVVIDEYSSKLDGIRLIQEMKSGSVFPILLFTPNGNEKYLLDAYKAGADECVTKPISPAMFLTRVQACLRRARCMPLESLTNLSAGGFRLDPAKRELTTGEGKTIRLSELEFRLLHLLMQNPGWVFETDDMVERIWGYTGTGNRYLLKHLVFRLRRKIEANPEKPVYIKTEPSIGYRFDIE